MTIATNKNTKGLIVLPPFNMFGEGIRNRGTVPAKTNRVTLPHNRQLAPAMPASIERHLSGFFYSRE